MVKQWKFSMPILMVFTLMLTLGSVAQAEIPFDHTDYKVTVHRLDYGAVLAAAKANDEIKGITLLDNQSLPKAPYSSVGASVILLSDASPLQLKPSDEAKTTRSITGTVFAKDNRNLPFEVGRRS